MKSIVKIKSLSAATIVVITVILLFTQFNLCPWKNAEIGKSLIRNDVVSYYGYLPAAFIHKDLSLNFIDSDTINYRSKNQFWPKTAPNGNKVFKFTMGMSMAYSPFFFVAHAYSKVSEKYKANGFSKPYEFALAISCLFYLIVGLFFLRKVLLLYFNEAITALALFTTTIGTNLFFYATSEPCMSHAYSFSFISIFIFLSIKWHKRQTIKKTILIGLLSGLIVLIRPVNLVILLFPFFLGVVNLSSLKENFNLFALKWKQLLVMAFFAFIVILPQLIYWKAFTGSWVYHSYVDEHFFFLKPHFLEFLFSYRKGWLIYTPVMIFALIGLLISFKNQKKLFLPLLLISIVNIYILSCWWCWWYGGSFGMRPMIDMYGFYAISIGFFLHWVASKRSLIKICFTCVFLAFIGLNIFQTQQRRHLVIHWDSMTKEAYWKYFLKYKFNSQQDWLDQEKILKHPNYQKAKKGEDEYRFKVY